MVVKVVELLVNLNEVNVAFSVVNSARTGTTMTVLTRKTVLFAGKKNNLRQERLLAFMCRFVAGQTGLPRKLAGFVLRC